MTKGGEGSFLVVSAFAVSFASVFATLLLTEFLVSSLFFLAFLETKILINFPDLYLLLIIFVIILLPIKKYYIFIILYLFL